MDVLLIDSWDLSKQDKLLKFLRQAVSVRAESVPLDLFYQTICHLMEGIYSFWAIFSDTQPGIVNPLGNFSQTTCHHFRRICSKWKVFTDERSIPLTKKLFIYSLFPRRKTALAVFPFMASLAYMVAFSFYETFRKWEKNFKNTCYNFCAILSFALLPSIRFNLHVYFRLFCQTTIFEMPSLIRKEKITFVVCGAQTTEKNVVRQKKSCSAVTLYCTHCPNFSLKSRSDLKYHNAKKHSAPKPDVTFKCKLCYQGFPGFYNLLQHKNTQHRMQIG